MNNACKVSLKSLQILLSLRPEDPASLFSSSRCHVTFMLNMSKNFIILIKTLPSEKVILVKALQAKCLCMVIGKKHEIFSSYCCNPHRETVFSVTGLVLHLKSLK